MKIQLPNGDYAETVCAIARVSHRAGQPLLASLVAKSCEGEVFYYKATYQARAAIKAAKFYADGWLNRLKIWDISRNFKALNNCLPCN